MRALAAALSFTFLASAQAAVLCPRGTTPILRCDGVDRVLDDTFAINFMNSAVICRTPTGLSAVFGSKGSRSSGLIPVKEIARTAATAYLGRTQDMDFSLIRNAISPVDVNSSFALSNQGERFSRSLRCR